MALTPYVKTVYLNDQAPPLDEINLNNSEDGIEAVSDEVIAQGNVIADLQSPIYTDYTPQATSPAQVEGRTYYDSDKNSFSYYTDIAGVTINTAVEQVVRGINRSGATIINGTPVRYVGIDTATGLPSIEPAQADAFLNAHVAGVITHDVGTDEECWTTVIGLVGDVVVASVMETGQTMIPGARVYLSATEAGKYTHDAPDIVVTCGGFFTGEQGVSPGDFFVRTYGVQDFPTLVGYLQDQNTPVYSLTATPQNIVDYAVSGNVVLPTDALTGTITTYGVGIYDFSFTASMSFVPVSTTRSIYIHIYDVTNVTEKFVYTTAIPRDAADLGVSFSFPANTIAATEYVMQISSDDTFDVTIGHISYNITSKNVR